jgi:hypothetical protein
MHVLLYTGWATGVVQWDLAVGSGTMVNIASNNDPLGTQNEDIESPSAPEPEFVALPNALDPAKAYALVLQHRVKRFNSVDVLRRLEYPKGGKAHMDIPLCRMKSLQVVRPALQNDIMKLQTDFVHGYRAGAAVFYVSLTDEHGKGSEVTAVERAQWDQHWQQRDREFEMSLTSYPDLKSFSNKYFYVWDGNHRLLAWTDHIDKVHKNDLVWHYRVRSILLKTVDSVTDALTSMHDINKSTENSHVKSNLVHTLHRMQTVGKLGFMEFKDWLNPEELEAARIENSKPDKKTWYPIPRARFLEYLYSVSVEPQTRVHPSIEHCS